MAFPADAPRSPGFQLGKVEAGHDLDDRKPRGEVGAGTREIRLHEASGEWRVMYVVKFEEAIYVLHCFAKASQATSRRDKAIAEARYRAVAEARKALK